MKTLASRICGRWHAADDGFADLHEVAAVINWDELRRNWQG